MLLAATTVESGTSHSKSGTSVNLGDSGNLASSSGGGGAARAAVGGPDLPPHVLPACCRPAKEVMTLLQGVATLLQGGHNPLSKGS